MSMFTEITSPVGWLMQAFTKNFSITLLAALVPLGLGVLLSFFASRSRTAEKVFSWLSLSVECICPSLLMVAIFFVPGILALNGIGAGGSVGREGSAILALAICFLFYMPARYISEYSFLKNILYNGLGLLSALFKWSMVARMVSVKEISMMATEYLSTGLVFPFIVALAYTTVVVLLLEVGKRIIKYKMK